MFLEAREAGRRKGVSVPLHGPRGRVAVMSFATGADDVDPEPYLGYLNALASQSTYCSPPWLMVKVTILPSSCHREKKIACGGSCKESHLGTSARSWVSAKTLSPFTSRRP
jgi:Autoinducer binding domain